MFADTVVDLSDYKSPSISNSEASNDAQCQIHVPTVHRRNRSHNKHRHRSHSTFCRKAKIATRPSQYRYPSRGRPTIPSKIRHNQIHKPLNCNQSKDPTPNPLKSDTKLTEPRIITLNARITSQFLEKRSKFLLQYPKKRRIEPILLSNPKSKRRIEPELIGEVSKESVDFMKNLEKYFNAQKNAMFNEHNFEKYAFDNNSNGNNYYYHYLHVIHNENSMPILTHSRRRKYKQLQNENMTKDKLCANGIESDVSICSNPDDPLTVSSYRRKMIRSNRRTVRTPKVKVRRESKENSNENVNEKKNRKITDFFSPIISTK